jgi:methanogenic corrinoid protein MtbC1
MVNGYADVVINTGEDNYLTTADAVQKAHTVLASQLINERFAFHAGLPSRLQGLGHAFEIDPELPNGLLWELAQAQMAREIFPDCPLKYMPPTKHMTGNIFLDFAKDCLFNFVSKATDQEIHLLGMLTEAIHNPHLQDRYLALQGAQYVMNGMADFHEECQFRPDGIIARRAGEVLDEAIALLEQVDRVGLFAAIGEGRFADVRRAEDGGKGFEGVLERADDYWNPVETLLSNALHTHVGGVPAGRPPVAETVHLEEIRAPQPPAAADRPVADVGRPIAPYGDTLDDGAVQLSFTLPVDDSPLAREAAVALLAKLGLRECQITHAATAGAGFTFFVAYGRTDVRIDPAELSVPEAPAAEWMDFDQVNAFIEQRIGRRLVVVGACTGSDAHTVGIDAIMNMKGCKHHWGLERYPMFEAHNLGAQVLNADCIRAAKELNADAILISQVNTEKNRHIQNMRQFIALLAAEGMRGRVLAIAGGPRISHKLALELGFDAGFGKGTYAEHVATFIARRIAARGGGTQQQETKP